MIECYAGMQRHSGSTAWGTVPLQQFLFTVTYHAMVSDLQQ